VFGQEVVVVACGVLGEKLPTSVNKHDEVKGLKKRKAEEDDDDEEDKGKSKKKKASKSKKSKSHKDKKSKASSKKRRHKKEESDSSDSDSSSSSHSSTKEKKEEKQKVPEPVVIVESAVTSPPSPPVERQPVVRVSRDGIVYRGRGQVKFRGDPENGGDDVQAGQPQQRPRILAMFPRRESTRQPEEIERETGTETQSEGGVTREATRSGVVGTERGWGGGDTEVMRKGSRLTRTRNPVTRLRRFSKLK